MTLGDGISILAAVLLVDGLLLAWAWRQLGREDVGLLTAENADLARRLGQALAAKYAAEARAAQAERRADRAEANLHWYANADLDRPAKGG